MDVRAGSIETSSFVNTKTAFYWLSMFTSPVTSRPACREYISEGAPAGIEFRIDSLVDYNLGL